ncbi:WD domain, G-beta repeat family protein [Clavispora lusitaniae]|uniref:Regulator of Ty1 transposition protein n=1 Tax=Clavispora lusitaniae (strain ATCC 42720) TaxID=306902 RepID=C4Y968_CLAL4|nr:uncharacterized protein CLUG_04745 [Clavispora lusitaniae ATCC 42720]EEQ40617.1 hypothetical protein CLUG_04745 [Clavispora lusitaniae ATCC 42720]KAF5209460.1 hypothetical protein E0198_003760 [Clavispora lusitaniae]KAF7581471.1 WD domain, G-beta repeat family protein [Clavispora lusitaniae]
MPNPVSSVNEHLLQEVQHYGPVTALKIYKNYILAGYGPVLKLFVIRDSKVRVVWSVQAFKRNKIHGIAITSNALAIFGGRSFSVFRVDWDSFVVPTTVVEKAINEWIVSCEFLTLSQLLMLTSHNEVLKVNISDLDSFQFSVEEKIHCAEKSILYSGSITVTDDEQILVAAGTVMSGVLVWDLRTRQPVYKLTDHQGSIFGVKIDPSGKYLISCSDDRSIKLYDLPSSTVLSSGWGHRSRIWSLHFASISPSIKLFTTGEDCTARLWEYVPGSESLKQVELWDHCHSGKHVWSSDVDYSHLSVSVTGGADGKVRLHDLREQQTNSFDIESIAVMSGVNFGKKEAIKSFSFLPKLNLLVVLTSSGKVLTCKDEHWTHVSLNLREDQQKSLNDFGIMKSFPEANALVVVMRPGDLLLLTFDASAMLAQQTWIENSTEKKKVINALVDFDSSKKEYYLFLDCPNPNVPFDIKVFTLHSNGELTIKKTLLLYKPDPKIFTPTSIHYDKHNQWFLIGSRHANFAIYNLAQEHYELPSLVRKLCPGDTITSISTVQSGDNNLVALLTVRDGLYLYLRVNVVGEKFVFDIILQNKVSRGIIEGGFVSDNNLFLYGFHSLAFFMWNETKQIEVAHQPCGGAHRLWDLFSSVDCDYRFVYVSKSDVVVREIQWRFKDSNNGLLIEGTHGREVRGIALSPVQELDGSRLLATASEDATIKLGNIYSDGSVRYQWTMTNHISGLQTVKFLNHEYMASSAANEELLVWRLQRLANSVVTIVEHSRLSSTEENPDLRVMDFSSIEATNGFWIAAVYSNSKIKIWFYDSNEKQFSLAAEDTYSTFCILGVEFIQDGDSTMLVIATTDGYLTFYDVSNVLNLDTVDKLQNVIIKQQLHQSGIKAFLVLPQNGYWRIITGGDDNALVSSRLSQDLILTVDCFVEKAASATITGIAKAGEKEVLVTSVDQIVRLWSYDERSLVCKSAAYTTVADTGCCDATKINGNNLAVVGGAGIGIWTW